MADTEPTSLGKYDVLKPVGRGAMGTVYEGFDPIIARRVAIKTVRLDRIDESEAAEDLLRFKREAQAAGRLTHPNIVGVYDYGETDTLAYIVMEFVEGDTLKSLLDKGERFTAPDAVAMIETLLSGIGYSHDNGVIHRDIKPANVMITKDGRVKLADFGVARIESSSLTQAGTLIGTPSYMSPEQFMGQTIDLRTDIYSAGVLLYQLLTGEKPFEGSVTAIMHKVLNTEAPLPSALSVSVTPALDGVVRCAMAKRPEDRFATARDFAAALRSDAPVDPEATIISPASFAASPSASGFGRPTSPAAAPQAVPASAGRSRWPMLAGGAAVILLLAGGGFVLLGGHHAVPKPASVPQSASPVAPASAPTPTPTPTPAPATSTPAPFAPATQAPKPTPGPAPSPAPAPAATPTKLAPAMVKAKLTEAIAPIGCALIHGSASPGAATLAGLIDNAHRPALAQALSGQAGIDVASSVRSFSGPYCGLIDAARTAASPFAPAGASLGLSLAGGVTSLRQGQHIVVELALPDWQAHVEVDYVSSSGAIYRLYPDKLPGAPQPANSTLTLGQKPGAQWAVGAPYGQDMILAIASSAPIVINPQSPASTVKSFLPALRRTLAALKAKGDKVTTAALLVDTLEK